MTREPTTKADPVERDIERMLRPGAFIGGRDCSSFISDLAGVEAKVADLTTADPGRAVSLYETFLAGCHEKAEELDDSSGNLGDFVRVLFSGWIKARQAAGAGPEETASSLLGWMDDDPYGFCLSIGSDFVGLLPWGLIDNRPSPLHARLRSVPLEAPPIRGRPSNCSTGCSGSTPRITRACAF